MTITVELPPELEADLNGQAARDGTDPATVLLRRLAGTAPPPGTKNTALSESDLLLLINKGLSETEWARYDALSAERRAGTLTDDARRELIALTDRIEALDAERLVWLTELARRRGVGVRAVMADLGIGPRKTDALA